MCIRDSYRVEHPPIGEGGMGIVYRACDTRLDCAVALKEIKPEHLHDSQFRRRFALEAKLAAGTRGGRSSAAKASFT